MARALYMETTGITSGKTCGEIMEVLAQAGASQINQVLKDREVIGIRFTMEDTLRGTIAFSLPVRTEPIFKILNGRRPIQKRSLPDVVKGDQQQANRVAWRQIYRWILAQMAFIESGMVEMREVFYPYMLVGAGRQEETLYDFMEKGENRLTGSSVKGLLK